MAYLGPAPQSSQRLKDTGAYLLVHFTPLLSTLVLLQDRGGVLSVRLIAFQRSVAGRGPSALLSSLLPAPTPRMLLFYL